MVTKTWPFRRQSVRPNAAYDDTFCNKKGLGVRPETSGGQSNIHERGFLVGNLDILPHYCLLYRAIREADYHHAAIILAHLAALQVISSDLRLRGGNSRILDS